jgi:hypothetical protein
MLQNSGVILLSRLEMGPGMGGEGVGGEGVGGGGWIGDEALLSLPSWQQRQLAFLSKCMGLTECTSCLYRII